jgi:hypothetical protein
MRVRDLQAAGGEDLKITDRYASAVRSSNLKSKPDTRLSDSDVLGAAGLAGKRNPLALALLRLFTGDNHASGEIVQILGGMADGKAFRLGIEITRLECEDIGRMVLAWHRDGTCKPCHGHGFRLIEGAPSLSEHACKSCGGTGKVRFDEEFRPDRQELARWLLAEVEREQGIAGPAAMQMLAPRLEL